MDGAQVALAMRGALIVMLKLGGPPLVAGLAIGLVVSLLQAVTQINEATLAFLPKLVLIGGVLALLAPFMVATLTDYTHGLMDQVVAAGGR